MDKLRTLSVQLKQETHDASSKRMQRVAPAAVLNAGKSDGESAGLSGDAVQLDMAV